MSSAPFQPEAGGEPALGYRLVERLGSGGFGEVWKASTPGGFFVALKFIPVARAGAEELRALELLRDIRHPNLLATFAAWKIDDWLTIAMELADKTLLDRLREANSQGLPGIPRAELLDYFQGAARAIDFLNDPHAVPGFGERVAFQHRDIKPQNILLVGDGVKVADFGLVRIMRHAVTGHSGEMTPHYAAPEFFKGQTARSSDQYCLAVTYCKTRGGRLPFDGTLAEVMAGHVSRAPDLSMLAEAERGVVGRALEKEPDKRWPSCRAFVEALSECAVGPEGEWNLGATVTELGQVAPLSHLAAPPAVAAPKPPSAAASVSALPAQVSPELPRDRPGSGLRSWLIGRAPDCDLVVQHDAVSAHHCRLMETVSGFILEDLRSSNGTFVNGKRLDGKSTVRPADQVTLGKQAPMPWPTPAPPRPSADKPAPKPGSILYVGRDPDNDVVLDFPMISGRHARITITGALARIEDLGSTNGIALGSPSARITQATLKPSDTVYFGSLRVPAAKLLASKPREKNPGVTPPAAGSLVFGRDPACDVVLNYPMISARHARLVRSGGQLLLEDLGSTNGTYLNGARIVQSTPVHAADSIGLGSYSFKLTDHGDLEKHDDRGNITLEARAISVDVPKKRLIENASLTIFPGEIVALMGPSGAGKTTLMNALNGYTPPAEGDVLLNHRSLYENYARFAPYLGYVPQEDIIHSQLTVFEALYYTARLRLPLDFSDGDIRQRIAEVIQQLGLEGTENTLIGSPEKRGISGGQRKRVNLAMELITDPLLLFLDEPTSGLSSEDALLVMKHLRTLADAGKTILLTIHQPNLEIFRLIDNLAVVGKDMNSSGPGMLVYYGPAFPDAIRFFHPDSARPSDLALANPDGVLRGLSERKTDEWLERYRNSAYHRQYVEERSGKRPAQARTIAADMRPAAGISVQLAQWWTLIRRSHAIKMRDTWSTAILLAQAPVIAVLIVMVYGHTLNQEVTGDNWMEFRIALGQSIFMTVLSALWFGCTNAIREIVGEWSVYRRERMVALKIVPYVASKFAILCAVCFFQCLVFAGITHFWGGLAFTWAGFGLLFLVAVVGGVIGLTISAAARTSEMAIAVVPLVLVPMIIFGGVMRPMHKMHQASQWVCQAMPPRWAFEGVLILQSDRHPEMVPPFDPQGKKRDMAEHFFPVDNGRRGPGTSALVLGGMLICCYGAIHLILRRRDIH